LLKKKKKMTEKAETIGAGFVLEAWAEDISNPDKCIDTLCNSQNEYHCVRITNERPSKMTAICEGNDTNSCLVFEMGSQRSDKWVKPYKDIHPSYHPAKSISDKGAKIIVNNAYNYSETTITLKMDASWAILGGAPLTLPIPPEVSFKIKL
jgi:hypothetical protein